MRRKLSVALLVLMLGAGCSLTPIQMPLQDLGMPQAHAEGGAPSPDRTWKTSDAARPAGGDCLGCNGSWDRGDAGDAGSKDGLVDRQIGERPPATERGPELGAHGDGSLKGADAQPGKKD
jgi:hypothetical protein